jgi:hypothetical protein
VRRVVLLGLCGVILASCMGRAARLAARMEGRYEMEIPASGWSGVPGGGADYAWRNEQLGATLYADSNCGSRYQDLPLERLLQHQMTGIVVEKRILEDRGQVDGRTALTVRLEGRLDGVKAGVALTILKKDECVYDFVVLGPPNQFDAIFRDYEAALATFRAGD